MFSMSTILLMLAAFALGWFGRIFMERRRVAQTAAIDAAAGRLGDMANTAVADADAAWKKRAGGG